METLFGGIFLLYLIVFVLGIIAFIFWLKMLIVAIRHEFEHKGAWIFVIVLGQLPGAIVFYFLPYQQIKAGKKGDKAAAQSTVS